MEAGKDAALAFFLEAIAVAADGDDGGAVQEVVEDCGGQDRVAGEDLGPVSEGLVGGDDAGQVSLVTDSDDLKQTRRTRQTVGHPGPTGRATCFPVTIVPEIDRDAYDKEGAMVAPSEG